MSTGSHRTAPLLIPATLSLFILHPTSYAQIQQSPLEDVKKIPGTQVKPPTKTFQILPGWNFLFISNVSFQDTRLYNWYLGGEEQTTSLLITDFYAFFLRGKLRWDQTLLIRYGLLRKNGSWTKTQDLLEIIQIVNWQWQRKRWSWTAMLNGKTQLTPTWDQNGKLVGLFLSPAWFTLGLGTSFTIPRLQMQNFWAPLAGKLTILWHDSLAQRAAYGVDTGKHFRTELGTYLAIQSKMVFAKEKLVITTRLDAFAEYPFRQQTSLYPDFSLELLLSWKPFAWFGIQILTRFFYDQDFPFPESPPEQRQTFQDYLQTQFIYTLGFSIHWAYHQTQHPPR